MYVSDCILNLNFFELRMHLKMLDVFYAVIFFIISSFQTSEGHYQVGIHHVWMTLTLRRNIITEKISELIKC